MPDAGLTMASKAATDAEAAFASALRGLGRRGTGCHRRGAGDDAGE